MTGGLDFRVSLLTPDGPAGVAVIELRGQELTEVLARVGAKAPAVGSFALVHLQAEGERLDEALVCARAEDRIELHVHGSVPLVRELIERLGGETPRATWDLEADCWQAMADAPSEQGARIALAQSQGLLGKEIQRLIDLPENEFPGALAGLQSRGDRAKLWLEPTRIALQGPPNAGKSTLFNALVGFARVVTSDEAGTTRDPVLESACLAGLPVELVDTAGLRRVEPGSLEGRGQVLGQKLAQSAQVTFHLTPHGDAVVAPGGTHALVTHGDRPGAPAGSLDALHEPLAAAEAVGLRLLQILDVGEPWCLEWAAPCSATQRRLLEQVRSQAGVSEGKDLLREALSGTVCH
ncbi:MAG: 50S ribosome-binding GTPase [Planctomycetota bacterium]|nr:50S ribosome-binding GTPase [Planctomycetota bacterium]